MEVSNVSKEVIFILGYSIHGYMDYAVSRGCETFKRDKMAENDNITVCRNFICISYNHYAFSKPAVIVPLTSTIMNQGD